jgi:hypothetical protein
MTVPTAVGTGWQAFPIGIWDVHALVYIGNDQTSSIAVDPGLVARLCAEDGLWGDCFDFHQGQDESTWFKSYAQILNSRTSSLSVMPGVTVYQYPNFGGNRWTYAPGSYNHAAFRNVLNDQLSSLITAPGILVQLCSESGGWGDCITVEGDTKVATLPAGMNDRTSHIAVSKGVTVYTEAHFEGQKKTFAPGTYDVSALGVVGNDRVSSLVVPSGLEVQLCSESGGWGTCRTFRGNVSFVGPDMDNRTSWLRVTAVDHSSLRRPIGTLPMTLP